MINILINWLRHKLPDVIGLSRNQQKKIQLDVASGFIAFVMKYKVLTYDSNS